MVGEGIFDCLLLEDRLLTSQGPRAYFPRTACLLPVGCVLTSCWLSLAALNSKFNVTKLQVYHHKIGGWVAKEEKSGKIVANQMV